MDTLFISTINAGAVTSVASPIQVEDLCVLILLYKSEMTKQKSFLTPYVAGFSVLGPRCLGFFWKVLVQSIGLILERLGAEQTLEALSKPWRSI